MPSVFRTAIFFKFRFFGLINDPNEISNVKKKSLGHFTVWPEVKITRLIDIFSAVFSNRVSKMAGRRYHVASLLINTIQYNLQYNAIQFTIQYNTIYFLLI